MKKIEITHENKNYSIEVTFMQAYPYGYYKIDWDDPTLLKIMPSPIYINCNKENSLSLPYFKNFEELTFFTSIAHGIFLEIILKHEI